MKIGSKTMVRDINSCITLESIINSRPISRSALALKLGLTKATISSIVQDLMSRKLVKEIGSDDTNLGRKPILLAFDPKAGYAVAIDFGPSTTSVIFTDLAGDEQQLRKIRTPTKKHLIHELIALIDSMCLSCSDSPYGIVGIAAGYEQKETSFAEEVSEYFHVPVVLESKASLAVIGEHTFMYPVPNLVSLNADTKVSLGVILNNQLYRGTSGYNSEFGHTVISANGRPCSCGTRGCLAQYICPNVLLSQFGAEKDLKQATFSSFFHSYMENDPQAVKIMEDFLFYMSIACNNILNTLHPDLIIINSPFTNHLPDLAEQIAHSIKYPFHGSGRIKTSSLKESSVLLGGISLAIKNFLGVETLSFL